MLKNFRPGHTYFMLPSLVWDSDEQVANWVGITDKKRFTIGSRKTIIHY